MPLSITFSAIGLKTTIPAANPTLTVRRGRFRCNRKIGISIRNIDLEGMMAAGIRSLNPEMESWDVTLYIYRTEGCSYYRIRGYVTG